MILLTIISILMLCMIVVSLIGAIVIEYRSNKNV
jgi:hypothetical protein